jgi:hypothetical protein
MRLRAAPVYAPLVAPEALLQFTPDARVLRDIGEVHKIMRRTDSKSRANYSRFLQMFPQVYDIVACVGPASESSAMQPILQVGVVFGCFVASLESRDKCFREDASELHYEAAATLAGQALIARGGPVSAFGTNRFAFASRSGYFVSRVGPSGLEAVSETTRRIRELPGDYVAPK